MSATGDRPPTAVARAQPDDVDDLAALRRALWPELDLAGHRQEVLEALTSTQHATFVARGPRGQVVGFAEASLRTDYVNGCSTSPVVFLEGIFVVKAFRRRGVARELVRAVEAWGREAGCDELASDAEVDNTGSRAMHAAIGFEETGTVVFFRKGLR